MVFAKGTLSLIGPSGSAGDYVSSIERLNTMRIEAIFPGHGKISLEPEADLLAAAEAAKARLQAATAKGGLDTWSESTPIDADLRVSR